MEGHLLMSVKERKRLLACQRIAENTMSVVQAADMLSVSVRQMRRSVRRYEQHGDAGLVHRGRGRPSNRAPDETFKAVVLARYGELYEDFGPTLAAEKLAGEGLVVDHETLRRWLVSADLWRVRRRRARHRSARERKKHFGQLVQFDGSHHDWFEGRRGRCCLMQMVDDATGQRMMSLGEEETTLDAMGLLRAWIERHGVPKALYTDRKTVYVALREPTIEEQLAGVEPLTAFGEACARLGIVIIAANSPQAKGRVERANGVAQDRLVKEMRLARACTIEEGNAVIATGLLDSRFAVPAADPTDFHRDLSKSEDLDTVFRIRQTRRLSGDYTLRHERRVLQVRKQKNLPPAGTKVTVARCLDGTLRVEHAERELEFVDVTEKLTSNRKQELGSRQAPRPPVPPVPGPDHPWRRLPPMPDPRWAGAHYNSQDGHFR